MRVCSQRLEKKNKEQYVLNEEKRRLRANRIDKTFIDFLLSSLLNMTIK